MRGIFCISVIALTLASACYGQGKDYRFFENVSLGAEASSVGCFVQDGSGMVWIGSNRGLYSYDDYRAQPHFEYDTPQHTHVYCAQTDSEGLLYLGSDNGLLVYDYYADRYVDHLLTGFSVRAMLLRGEQLWIGTLDGLFRCDTRTMQLQRVGEKELPHQTVYSLAAGERSAIYIGTYDGLCRYDADKGELRRIPLPRWSPGANLLVNSLLADTERHVLWIGTEGALFSYDPATGAVSAINPLRGNSIKTLILDFDGRLLAGTDNGLYVYAPGTGLTHIVHDSRNTRSLADNIVWSLFADREKNIWIGTDNGVSLYRYNPTFRFNHISQLTGTGEGNHIYAILRDSHGYLWFGGANGIIRSDTLGNNIWYKQGDARYPLGHNRIRDIYEDRDGGLWISTDAGIHRYDYASRQFVNYLISDSTGNYNAKWAYSLVEDGQGKLWIASCLGGIFSIDKRTLLKGGGGSYTAEKNYTTASGLSSDFINRAVLDERDQVWILPYNNDLNRIDRATGQVERFPAPGRRLSQIIPDPQGGIRIGYRGGIARLDAQGGIRDTVRFDRGNRTEVLAMAALGADTWVATTSGVWVVRQGAPPRRLYIPGSPFTSLFYDAWSGKFYMGGGDGFTIVSPEILSQDIVPNPIMITWLSINNRPYESLAQSIRYTDQVTLAHNQNNLSLGFSDLGYSRSEKSGFAYRLEGVDHDWHTLNPGDNTISYANLPPGRYRLQIRSADAQDSPGVGWRMLSVTISPPWYYTMWAKLLYGLIGVAAAVWVVNFFRVRHRLKMERIEKENSLRQSRLKIDFFTEVSHEFKTPLSLIIGPLSKMLSEAREPDHKRQLELVQQNAMKLNSLIHEAIDFDRMDANHTVGLILSRIEAVSFAGHIFEAFAAGSGKRIDFQMETDTQQAYLDGDAVKLESVLYNLLSNAVKFTPEGGKVTLRLDTLADKIEISVTDTGIGIPEAELPLVFQRFYQSSKTTGRGEGTGIGLYLVKLYVELHGGSVTVRSIENQGTTMTVTLPTVPAARTQTAPRNDGKPKPKLLVVEDNTAIAGFICEALGGDYECRQAADGKQGLDEATAWLPDIIITDEMMPVMDGLEMCRRLRKNSATSAIPIVMLTAKDDKKTELESIRQRIDAFIPKPFNIEILASRLAQLLEKSRTIEDKLRVEAIADPKPIEAVSADEKLLAAVIAIIEEDISDSELGVNHLSERSGVSTKQLYRKIKQMTGLSPVDFIRSIRLKKAAMLLRQRKFTASEVMYMVGFSNYSYFSKCFQAEFGVTPKKYATDR